jgi:hypothetical protein
VFKLLVDTSGLKSILLKLPHMADCEVSTRLVISCLSEFGIIVFGLKGISRWSTEISQQLSSHCSWLKRQQSCLSNGQGVSSCTRYQLTRLVFDRFKVVWPSGSHQNLLDVFRLKVWRTHWFARFFMSMQPPHLPLLVGYQGQRPTGLS